jgi:hypothetical protein
MPQDAKQRSRAARSAGNNPCPNPINDVTAASRHARRRGDDVHEVEPTDLRRSRIDLR